MQTRDTFKAILFYILLTISSHFNSFTLANSNTFLAAADWFTNGTTDPWVYMESTLIVPPIPQQEWQHLYLWPGLQPRQGDPNFNPIKLGVLQPVLSFGSNCAPNKLNQSIDYKNVWWVTGMYANVETNLSGYFLCHAGDRVAVEPGHRLRMILKLLPGTTIWRQLIINLSQPSQIPLQFDMDMKGQVQSMAVLAMEFGGGSWRSNPPKWDVYNITLRTNGNGLSSSFCEYQQVLVPEEEAPDISLHCSLPEKRGNVCFTSRCSFNQDSRKTISNGSVVNSTTQTPSLNNTFGSTKTKSLEFVSTLAPTPTNVDQTLRYNSNNTNTFVPTSRASHVDTPEIHILLFLYLLSMLCS